MSHASSPGNIWPSIPSASARVLDVPREGMRGMRPDKPRGDEDARDKEHHRVIGTAGGQGSLIL